MKKLLSFRKATAFTIAAAMACSVAANPQLGAVSYAKEAEVATVTVDIYGQSYNSYVVPPCLGIEVAGDLAESYGFDDSIDPAEGVSALDALVKLHEEIFGAETLAEDISLYLEASSSGFVTTIFGEETSSNGFAVNDGYPNDGTESEWGGYMGTTVTTTALSDGDKVDFFIYQDTSFWSDYYSFVDAPESVNPGERFDATALGTMFMMGYMYADPAEFRDAAEPLDGVCLGWLDMSTGYIDIIAITGEDGTVGIEAPTEEGTYYLVACNDQDDYYYTFLNPTKITVEVTPVVPVSAIVNIYGQAYGNYVCPPMLGTEVSSDLAEKYGYTDSIEVEYHVSALDVLVKLHEEIFGKEAFAAEPTEYLAVSDAGYVTKIFCEATSANGFLVCNGIPNDGTESQWGGYNGLTVNTTTIFNGDKVEFYMYQDTSFYSDYLSYISLPGEVCAGSKFIANASGSMVMMGYLYKDEVELRDASESLEGACFGWVDMETGAIEVVDEVVADKAGNAEITAPEKAGEYYLTVYTNEEEEVYVLVNPAKITVVDHVITSDPQFVWSEDGTKCTAYVVCDNCADEEELEGVEVTSEKACLKTTYTAKVTYNGTEFSDTNDVENDVPEHKWGEPVFAWTDDGEVCEIEVTCEKCEAKDTIEPVTIDKEYTCYKNTFTAKVIVDGTEYSDTKVVELVEPLHTYAEEPEYEWSEDGKTCKVTYACKNCEYVHEDKDAMMTFKSDCYKTTYYVTSKFNGGNNSDEKEVPFDEPNHKYSTTAKPVFKWADDCSSCTATFTCMICGGKGDLETKITSETTAQKVVYTASVFYMGKTFESTKTVTLVPENNYTVTLDSATATVNYPNVELTANATFSNNLASTYTEYKWVAMKDGTNEWFEIAPWSKDAKNYKWTPEETGNYVIVAYARVIGNDAAGEVTAVTSVEYHKHVKGICQLPYEGEGGGFLIGFESYDNPNQEYQYEMLILDCTLLAQGKPAWVMSSGRYTVPENCLWTVWQPEYGYFWTLFRIYDKDGNLIDEVCYGFANVC